MDGDLKKKKFDIKFLDYFFDIILMVLIFEKEKNIIFYY